jgi:hypothetical protein
MTLYCAASVDRYATAARMHRAGMMRLRMNRVCAAYAFCARKGSIARAQQVNRAHGAQSSKDVSGDRHSHLSAERGG